MLTRLRLMTAWVASLIYWLAGGAGFLLLCLLLPLLLPGARARLVGQGALQLAFRGFLALLGALGIVE